MRSVVSGGTGIMTLAIAALWHGVDVRVRGSGRPRRARGHLVWVEEPRQGVLGSSAGVRRLRPKKVYNVQVRAVAGSVTEPGATAQAKGR
jgi:hypothetical protein